MSGMAEMGVVVCDVCGKFNRATVRYRVATGGSEESFDLCEEHAAPIEAVLATKRPGPRPVPAVSAPITIDELGARKRAKAEKKEP